MSKKTLYAFIISFFLLIAVIILNRFSFNAMRSYTEEIDHTRQVISEFRKISDHLKSAQIYTPSYDTIAQKNFYKLFLNLKNVLIPESIHKNFCEKNARIS